MHSLLLILAGSVILLGCPNPDTAAGPGEPQGPGNPGTVPTSGVVQGLVVDTQGRPVAGAKIIIDNTIYYNSAITGRTDAQGRYRLEVPAGSWRAYAQHTTSYEGEQWTFEMAPEIDESFAGTTGAVRNFRWKLTGRAGETHGREYYGGDVWLAGEPNADGIEIHNVEYTFTPAGPLVDGSAGQVLTLRPPQPRMPHYSKLMDVPVGRYMVTARYAPPGESPRPMKIRLTGTGAYAPSITAAFRAEGFNCERCLKLEVNWP